MKYILVVTLMASLLGSSPLAQHLTYSPEARQVRLLDQAAAALRKVPPAPTRKAEARVLSAAQPSPGQNQPYWKRPWFLTAVAAAVAAGFCVAKCGGDDSSISAPKNTDALHP